MNQKLLLMLKTLFASKGFGQKTIEGLAALVAPNLTEESTDEEITTAIKAVEPYANIMQAENTRYANEVKSKLPKPGETTITTTEQKTDVDPNETPTDKALHLIMEKLDKQEQAIAQFGQEKVVNTRRDQYAKTLEGTSEKYKAKALKDFDRISSTFKTDDEFTDWLTGESEVAKDFIAEDQPGFLGNDRPAGGTGKNAGTAKVSDAELDSVVDNIL